ncbi:MAG: 9-O-acetylesterase, partial [Treponema sp.]|nr:9-O-acetylesterase [Treponema sp.]
MKELGLSTFINHRMVIQREKPFPLWSCKKIAVNFLEKTYEAKSVDGRWLVSLDPAQAGGPFSMNIASENESFEITDIYIGDVWLCAGQSNMEMQMQRLKDDFSEEWQLNEYPLVRQFKVPQEWDFSAPSEDLTGGNWLSASAETLHEFSGTAWFFARKMYEKYRIPIGLVNTAWGGTPVEAWMSRGALAPWVEKIAAGDQYADAAKREAVAKESEQAINVWNNALNASDIGLAQNWKNGDWEKTGGTMSLPGDFAEAGLKSFCGVLWLKKEFVINENLNDNYINEEYKVWLGTITDADTVYINGVEIGNTGYRYPPRKYSIPHGVLQKGKNTIIIRVICNNGEGGVTIEKDFRVFSQSESVELAGDWEYCVGIKVPDSCPEQFFFQRQPMGNYNAMIAPVLKFPLKGVIWYQGESNEQNPHEYAALFQT